jgi:LuxR family maltose regulon positive regulatory protein
MVDYLPPSLHLVLAGRGMPRDLPLGRLRARAQLGEVTEDALALSFEETAGYAALTGAHGVDARELYARTLGWITGLRLLCAPWGAAPRPAVNAYFDRHVGPDLTPELRAFLRQVAPLATLTAASCAAMTGRGDGQAMLETLEARGLFLLPLDGDRCAWRLHPMMRDWVVGTGGKREDVKRET